MMKLRDYVSAASLVLYPLLIFCYWWFYPAYGLLDAGAVARAINGHAGVTLVANGFALAGTLLSIPASLALMRVLGDRSPRLALLGGAMSILGWTTLIGALIPDVIAAKLGAHGDLTPASVTLFEQIVNSPTMIALNILVTFHIIGGVLLGVAMFRTRLVPRWAGIAAAITPPIHLASNIAGQLWIDELTWIAVAAAYACVARLLLQPVRSPAEAHAGDLSAAAT
jgi:hypothetical protein